MNSEFSQTAMISVRAQLGILFLYFSESASEVVHW